MKRFTQDTVIFIGVIVSLLLLLFLASISRYGSYDRIPLVMNVLPHATFGDTQVTLTVADTQASRTKGLSGRPGLGADEGMLFVFEQLGYPGIWMKDMQFSIDVLWLDQTNTIVDIREVVSPETYPQVFAPKAKSIFVIELPAGFVQEHEIKIGDQISIKK
ncbi:MAG: DUF192 domain-containing protein [Patescibacteria group bacterium]